jgi:hypothetical protein
MERATCSALEAEPIQEDTRAIHNSGCSPFLSGENPSLQGFSEKLEVIGIEARCIGCGVGSVGLIGKFGAQGTAAKGMGWILGISNA